MASFERVPKYRLSSYQQPNSATNSLLANDLNDTSLVVREIMEGGLALFYKGGVSVLHRACERNAAASVTLLLDSYCGADNEVALRDALGARTDASQETALLSACRTG
jgi:ankyrin repeat protein